MTREKDKGGDLTGGPGGRPRGNREGLVVESGTSWRRERLEKKERWLVREGGIERERGGDRERERERQGGEGCRCSCIYHLFVFIHFHPSPSLHLSHYGWYRFDRREGGSELFFGRGGRWRRRRWCYGGGGGGGIMVEARERASKRERERRERV